MRIIWTIEIYNDWTGMRAVKRICEELVKKGNEVIVLTSPSQLSKEKSWEGKRHGNELAKENINGVSVKRFNISGNALKGISGPEEEIAAFKNCLENSGADIIINYAAQCWPTDLALEIADLIRAKKVFVPVGYSKLNHVKWKKYFSDLPEKLRSYNALVYLSKNYRDFNFDQAKKINEGKLVRVISNFAEAEEFIAPQKYSIRELYKIYPTHNPQVMCGIKTPYVAVSVSNHAFAKNHFFLLNVARRLPAVTFLVFGHPQKFPRTCWPICRAAGIFLSNVKFITGASRPEIVDALRQADACLITSSVECDPVVMYESFAAKVPLISTSVGSVPEFGQYIELARTPAEMAEKLKDLLANPEKRQEIGSKVFELWKNNFTLENAVQKYEALFGELLGRPVSQGQSSQNPEPAKI